MSNIEKTWTVINEFLFRRKKNLKTITAIKDPNNKNKLLMDSSHIPNIVNEHFASVGGKLGSKIPSSQQNYLDFVNKNMFPMPSFFFQPLTHDSVKTETLQITRFILLPDKVTKMLN